MRPAVTRFADQLEARLASHDGELGATGWRKLDIPLLEKRLHRHLTRMGAALRSDDKVGVVKQATDSANYLMMIADNLTVGDAKL